MGGPEEVGVDVGRGVGGPSGRREVPEGMLAGRGEACLDAKMVSEERIQGAVIMAEVPKGVLNIGFEVLGEEGGGVLWKGIRVLEFRGVLLEFRGWWYSVDRHEEARRGEDE